MGVGEAGYGVRGFWLEKGERDVILVQTWQFCSDGNY